jgi:hypothetical protein
MVPLIRLALERRHEPSPISKHHFLAVFYIFVIPMCRREGLRASLSILSHTKSLREDILWGGIVALSFLFLMALI